MARRTDKTELPHAPAPRVSAAGTRLRNRNTLPARGFSTL